MLSCLNPKHQEIYRGKNYETRMVIFVNSHGHMSNGQRKHARYKIGSFYAEQSVRTEVKIES